MTRDRDFKHYVRSEAKRTGASYQQTLDHLDEERRAAEAAAQLALREADGKPVVPPLGWNDELSALHRRSMEARDAARAADADADTVAAAQAASARFEEAIRDFQARTPRRSIDEYLADVVGHRRRVAEAAIGVCEKLLALNRGDEVASEAIRRLRSVAETLEEQG